VAAEAAAAGTPVVLTDRCGIADLVRDRGALVVAYEQAAVTAAIERVLSDGELRRRLAEGGRAVAREWSWQRVAAQQEKIYRSILVDG
jgi:glycosyltransferase involved in cell wall biosynthesis